VLQKVQEEKRRGVQSMPEEAVTSTPRSASF
jgi:hypothetical protein